MAEYSYGFSYHCSQCQHNDHVAGILYHKMLNQGVIWHCRHCGSPIKSQDCHMVKCDSCFNQTRVKVVNGQATLVEPTCSLRECQYQEF